MSDDITQRLRAAVPKMPESGTPIAWPVKVRSELLLEAAAQIERLRAEIERLYNEDTKTRHALKGWVFVCPDGGDEPTHERVSAVVAEVEKQRAEIERLRADNERMHNVLYRIARKRPFVHNPWALARAALEGEP